MAVFYVAESGEMLRVRSTLEVHPIKRHMTKGYNVVAVIRGSAFYARLSGLAQRP